MSAPSSTFNGKNLQKTLTDLDSNILEVAKANNVSDQRMAKLGDLIGGKIADLMNDPR